MDIAENVLTLYQDDIQAAHWHKIQITVFTIRIKHWKTPLSWIIVTDLNTHDKHTVAAFLFAVITTILSSTPTAKKIRIWMDGPSSQFRNNIFLGLAAKLQQIYPNPEITWDMFAPSHGKGPFDAIRSTCKRQVVRLVKARKRKIRNAEDFMKALIESGCQIKITHFIE